jgi:large-conductance mechanosensitive channel
MKKMGFADRAIFILGLTLASVITFVIVAGVVVAVLKFYMESRERNVQIHAAPKQHVEEIANSPEGDGNRGNPEPEEN